MLYIIGKNDLTIVFSEERNVSDINVFLNNIATNHGGVAADYSYITFDNNTQTYNRIKDGDQWVPVWTGTVLTGISFADYDATNKIRFITNKTEFLADNIDKSRVTFKLISPSDVDLVLNATVYVPVQSPLGVVKKKVDIVNGEVQFDFKTTIAGQWTFPALGTKMIGNLRVKNQIVIDVLMV